MKIESKKIDIVDINKIVENPKNRNVHSEKQIDVLAKIIKVRGFRDPLVVSNRSGFLISGHARLRAAKKLGMQEVPVVYQDFETEADEYAHLIAANEIARHSTFDSFGFKEDLSELDVELDDFDFEEFGLIDFTIVPENIELDSEDNSDDEEIKKFIVEVTLPNDMETRDLYDDLISKGYVARIKNK